MRRVLLGITGATALALSSMAGAAVTVTGSTGLNAPDPGNLTDFPNAIQTVGNTTTINFGQNPVVNPNFSASFTLNNTANGNYTIELGTSDFGNVIFDTASLGSYMLTPTTADHHEFILGSTFLAAGNYLFTLTGHTPEGVEGGSFAGTVTIRPAVPEPGTWALMILGVGAMGMTLRRRRRPAFAQVA